MSRMIQQEVLSTYVQGVTTILREYEYLAVDQHLYYQLLFTKDLPLNCKSVDSSSKQRRRVVLVRHSSQRQWLPWLAQNQQARWMDSSTEHVDQATVELQEHQQCPDLKSLQTLNAQPGPVTRTQSSVSSRVQHEMKILVD